MVQLPIRVLAILASVLLLHIVAALPLVKRAWPWGDVTCGRQVYSLSQVKAAVSAGYAHKYNPIGSNSYPHKFNNYEGLNMWCSSESSYLEWPIIPGRTYNGGSPGADRVVFSVNGIYCAVITHTGASGNGFVSCDGD